MVTYINQVQALKRRSLLPSVTHRWFQTYLESRSLKLRRRVPETKRRYPGEIEAKFLLAYLDRFPKKQKAFLKLLRPKPDDRRATFKKIEETIKGGRWAYAVQEDGLVLLPTEPEGVAALAVVLLDFQERLHRIRQCRHCKVWFYAHLERQRFCSDPEKRCQWKHYHSPEWRKQHRERNRKNQRAYRERLFGKRR